MPNSESARWSPDRYFHFLLNGSGKVGSFVIIFVRTAASSSLQGPEMFPVLNSFWFATVNNTMEHDNNPCFTMPIPVTWMFQRWRWSHRCYAKYSMTNDVDEAHSSKAPALVIWPLDITTSTWHVIRSMLHLPLGLRCDKWDLWHVEESSTSTGNACVLLWPSLSLTLALMSWSNCWCSNMWCYFWHFWHLWLDIHCAWKWPDFKQL